MVEHDFGERVAAMTGTYWGRQVEGFPRGTRLKCIKPIAPENPDFEPSRYMFEVPDNLRDVLVTSPIRRDDAGYTVLVFSREDVLSWEDP